MSININLGAWRSVFAVPSKIVDEGLKFSDGVKLKVLLFVLRHAGEELALEEISRGTGVSVTDIPEALDYWVNLEILQKDNGSFAPVDSLKEISPNNNSEIETKSKNNSDTETKQNNDPEGESKTAETISREVEEKKQRFFVSKPQKPDYVFTAQRLAVDEELKMLVGEAQTALGKTISNSDAATLLMLKDTCGLGADVILMLIHYCVSINKANMRAVEKIGISWSDDGINSVEAADRRIARNNHSNKCFSVVSSVFGLQNAGSPTKKQLEYSTRWVGEWRFSEELLREAYERCVDSKGELKFYYIDGILRKWDSMGIKNMEVLNEKDPRKGTPEAKKKSSAASSTSSYDINELEKIDRLEFID